MIEKHSKLNIASMVMLVIMFAILVGFIYMLHFPRSVWELTEEPYTEGTEFRAGDVLPITASYCKTKDIPGVMVVQYVDGVIYTTPQFKGNVPVGCGKTTTQNVMVPKLPEGEYSARVTFIHEVNALRTITKTWETNKFQIVE